MCVYLTTQHLHTQQRERKVCLFVCLCITTTSTRRSLRVTSLLNLSLSLSVVESFSSSSSDSLPGPTRRRRRKVTQAMNGFKAEDGAAGGGRCGGRARPQNGLAEDGPRPPLSLGARVRLSFGGVGGGAGSKDTQRGQRPCC